MPPLISASDLKRRLGREKLHILDSTTPLPGDTSDVRKIFLQRRLPTSLYFDIDVFSDPESTLPHTVPSQARFEHFFGMLGISPSDVVVFYDQGNIASSCRGWWLARLFGHKNVYVLDGGLPEWLRHDGTLECGIPASPTDAVPYHSQPRYTYLKGLGDMLECVQQRSNLILDARSADRFYGRTAEPRPGLASGHMPEAVNLPFKQLLNETNCFKPVEILKKRFTELGISSQTNVITTCGSGMTASVLSFALCLAGFPQGALYDGSWAEWGATPEAPVTKG